MVSAASSSTRGAAVAAMTGSLNGFDCIDELTVRGSVHHYFSLSRAGRHGLSGVDSLPISLKVVLENLLRHEDGRRVDAGQIRALGSWGGGSSGKGSAAGSDRVDLSFHPGRVLLQDLTGVPAIADFAALREAMARHGGAAERINPRVDIDLVIDHSIQVDHAGGGGAFARNAALEYRRNRERYEFLRWGGKVFDRFRVAPPGAGICHQVNLEYLADVVRLQRKRLKASRLRLLYPDTLVGADSHTTMINGLSVLGWGVGGIEAEAVALGQAVSLSLPEVVGVRLHGALDVGTTAADLALTITEKLRALDVTGKFVEFFGPALAALSLEDRATIANMAPEYGATCGFFPVDATTVAYLRASGRSSAAAAAVEAYARAQGMFADAARPPSFSEVVDFDLGSVRACVSGPRRPQDRVDLGDAADNVQTMLKTWFKKGDDLERRQPVAGADYALGHGDVVIAAITSCTNTSNPSSMAAAGLLAQAARRRGLRAKPWVKTSLTPGSQVVSSYLEAAGLLDDLNALGFNVVGYGCATCIGNSGPLAAPIAEAVAEGDLVVASVLSGNRNFEGRIHASVRANYLASPPLVVAYALAGSMRVDLSSEPLGRDEKGKPVYLRDLWPTPERIARVVRAARKPHRFRKLYRDVFEGSAEWKALSAAAGVTYQWDGSSTYVKEPPFLRDVAARPEAVADIENAAILALLGDSITTDHISPAGAIKHDSPAGRHLASCGVAPADFNTYGSRRGNHEVMMRGTFANIRLRNAMADGREGGWTRHHPSGEIMPIYEAAMRWRREGRPLTVFAGRLYGSGSSRDWAAKGPFLLGVRAVAAQSFERIHRSNLIGMGIAPLLLPPGVSWETLGLVGSERIDVRGLAAMTGPRATVTIAVVGAQGKREIEALCCIETADEFDYYSHGGILPYVFREMMQAA